MGMISKFIAIIVVIVLVMVGIFYLLGGEKDGRVMDVNVVVYLDEEGSAKIISVNGTLREVNQISLPKDNDFVTPGVVANVLYKKRLIGYWVSTGVNSDMPLNSTATYNLTVGLLDKPVKGENVSITARLVGFRSEELDSVMTTFEIP